MTIPPIINHLIVAAFFSGIVSFVSTSALYELPDPLLLDAVVYGVLAAGAVLYFNRQLKFQALAILAASSVSLQWAIILSDQRADPDIFLISLIGGAIIWLAVLTLFTRSTWKDFALFSTAWFAACLIIGQFYYLLADITTVMFIWQAVTLFLLIRLFSSLSTRNQSTAK